MKCIRTARNIPTFYVPPPFLVFLETLVVVFAVVEIPDVSVPQVSVDIPAVFVVLIPAYAILLEVDIGGRPRFVALPKHYSFANPSNSGEVAHKELLIAPPVSIPRMVSVVISPMWVYVKKEAWYIIIVNPIAVVVS